MDPASIVNMSMIGRFLFCCDEAHTMVLRMLLETARDNGYRPNATITPSCPPIDSGRSCHHSNHHRQASSDTLEIHGQRIRLSGIDAPESDQLCRGDDSLQYHCGAKAANALYEHIAGRSVSCEGVGRDQYGRVVAVCSVGGTDLGEWLVSAGLAFDWPRYSKGRYTATQKDAERGGRGVWADRMSSHGPIGLASGTVDVRAGVRMMRMRDKRKPGGQPNDTSGLGAHHQARCSRSLSG
jgi:endonuclease YncB( thermonuclease family)